MVIDYWTAIVPINIEPDPWPIARPFTWHVWIAALTMVPIFLVCVGLANVAYEGSFDKAEWGRITGFTIRTAMIEPTYWYPQKV